MRRPQSGTSVLAALVFVAIFVLFISGYKIASQNAGAQSASAASAFTHSNDTCTSGQVYTVDMGTGSGSVHALKCFVPDPHNRAAMVAGPDSDRPECMRGIEGKCAVRYCPPTSYITESGTCFVIGTCDPANGASCLQSTIQNASQSAQAANIIAAQLLTDRGETDAQATGSSGHIALADHLSESGRAAVALIIDQTANAAAENNFDADAIRAIGRDLNTVHVSRNENGPVAQISCQPKIAQSGMKVGIAFGCTNSVSSAGGGFSTGGLLWGATEDRIAENLPNGTMEYALTCSDGRRSASASCSVAVMKPFMLLSSQAVNMNASLAWVTRGMDQCDLSSPGNTELSARFENPVPQSGALTIPAITTDTEIALTCTSVSGTVSQMNTTVHPTR